MQETKTNAPIQQRVSVTAASTIDSEVSLNSQLTPEPADDNRVNIISSKSIYQERLRQARISFNLAFGLTTVSAVIGFVGVLLLFSGNVSDGAVTAVGGATYGTVSASWLKLAQDANDRLDETAKMLEDES